MDNQKSGQSVAKTLLMVSLSIGIVIVASFVMAIALEIPTGKGAVYALFGFVSLLGLFLAPLPCLILSLIGTLKAWKASAERLIILGIVEAVCWAAVLVFASLVFMRGMSV